MSKPADLPNNIEARKALLAASEDRNLRKQDRATSKNRLPEFVQFRWVNRPGFVGDHQLK